MSDSGEVPDNYIQLYDAVPLVQPDSIRLIKLAEFDPTAATLSFTMSAAPLTSRIYHALSYTWMLADIACTQPPVRPDPLEIECNGLRISVGPNLYDALFTFAQDSTKEQKGHGPDLLWVDALCINQNDVEERNAQVQMMGKIYSQAALVVVWLGVSDQATIDALRVIYVFSKALTRMHYDYSTSWNTYRFNDPRFYSDANMVPISVEQWREVRRFMSRPWFRRVWVVQEVAMARRVVLTCGDMNVPWRYLNNLILFLQAEGWSQYQNREGAPGTGRSHTYGAESMVLMLDACKCTFEPVTDHLTKYDAFLFLRELYNFEDEEGFLAAKFAWLIQTARVREGTDPRDRVFAISNLVPELQQNQHWCAIAADYHTPTAVLHHLI